jgi:hypothetical protein
MPLRKLLLLTERRINVIGIWIPADLSQYANGATMGEFDLAHIEQLLGGEAQEFYIPNPKREFMN